MARPFLILITCLVAMPAWADDDSARFDFGGDAFRAGMSVTHDAAGADDLFMAGDRVTGRVDITGSAHLAGRKVTMEGAVSGDLYAAGEEVAIQGDVSGDASLLGRTVSVARVGGDLRVAASDLQVGGNIGGNAIIAGRDVAFDAAVGGDVTLAARNVDWGEAASIAGRLIIHEEELGDLEVPERVASVDRIERREVEGREVERQQEPRRSHWRSSIGDFLFEVIVVTILAVLIAALMPTRLAKMQRQVLARPIHTLWLGFLSLSAVTGASILLAVTIVGLPLVAALVLLAFVGTIAGYAVATYVLGARLLLATGRPEPDSIGSRGIAAGAGAFAAAVIGLVPFLGWLFAIALALAGIGAITVQSIRPVFFADTV
ncbi:MAG: hypothetical protein F4213_21760 [Boseongicola sp. SB0677_bin_26]|nr:hypothetical protein [Boseongicola sp. SB0665_bin_10]MYG28606.1 hypothetical protein [Boseongicola sp. SB0677_bin_26]